ncbi:MAG: hypothetical protein ACN6N7_00555 [Chryseobacterium culicis]
MFFDFVIDTRAIAATAPHAVTAMFDALFEIGRTAMHDQKTDTHHTHQNFILHHFSSDVVMELRLF